jgi:hypothetical protein
LRILFDKNVPYPLRRHLVGHQVQTAAEVGWSRLVNGELLNIAEAHGFDLMVTADQSLEYQQNLKGRTLALVVLSSNHIEILEAHPDRLVAAVNSASEGSYAYLLYELPVKPKPPVRR